MYRLYTLSLLGKGGPVPGLQWRLGATWILPGCEPAEYSVVHTRSVV